MTNSQNNLNKQQLTSAIEANQQIVAVFEADAFEKEWAEGNIVRTAQLRPSTNPHQMRDDMKSGAGYTIDALSIAKFSKMATDMGLNGQVILKTYDDKAFVIFRSTGNSHHFVTQLKQRLGKSKHISTKPKVVQIAIGNTQALKGAVRGGMITFAIFTAINIMDYIIQDKVTFAYLAGTIASDFAKITFGALAGAGFHAGASATLLSIGTTSAAALTLVPIVVAIVVGVGFGFLLNSIDNHYKLTDKIIAKIEDLNTKTKQVTYDVKQGLNYIEQNPIQAFSRIFGVPAIYF